MAVKTRAQLRTGVQAADPAAQQRNLIDSVAIGTQQAAITNATAATGGDAPTEAEFNAVVTKLNSALAALRAFGMIAP